MKKKNISPGTKKHTVVPRAKWIAARKALLKKEKQFTRLRDELNAERRKLPWVKVEKSYVFDGPAGLETLAALFGTRSQLLVYHFMFAPDWAAGCKYCSFWADHYDAVVPHLNARDTNLVVISRAPLAQITPFKRRMGWKFKWLSSFNNDFNYDFNVSFKPADITKGKVFYNYETLDMGMPEREGASAFIKDDRGNIFHTYTTQARGIDMLNTTYHFLDLTAKGRDENPDSPQDWVQYHDQYK